MGKIKKTHATRLSILGPRVSVMKRVGRKLGSTKNVELLKKKKGKNNGNDLKKKMNLMKMKGPSIISFTPKIFQKKRNKTTFFFLIRPSVN